MTDILYEREGPRAASIYVSIEGRETEMGYKQAWTTWGLNFWLQREIYKIREILLSVDPSRPVNVREIKWP